jgi:hypothetical protein
MNRRPPRTRTIPLTDRVRRVSEPEEDRRIRLAYDESVRAIVQQQESLNSLHTRAGLVLSAAAVTSSLFATQILKHGSPTCLTWNALAAFVVVGVAAVYVLWPRNGWRFSNDVTTLLSEWVDKEDSSIDVMQRQVAEFNQGAWSHNQKMLGQIYGAFQVASIALGIEVVLWLIDLGTR